MLSCPICSGEEFKDYNGRAGAQCTRCKSLERGRQLWLVLTKIGILQPHVRLLHFAPERFLLERLSALLGSRYHACDLAPERYRWRNIDVVPFDICHDLQKLPSDCYDVVLHNHVLEHIPCDVEGALREMIRVMSPGGHMLFTVPFRGDKTDEDLSPDLGVEERTQRFGQSDHLRIFGRSDFPEMLRRTFGIQDPVFHVEDHFCEELLRSSGIPPAKSSGRLDGNTVFHYQKPGIHTHMPDRSSVFSTLRQLVRRTR